MIGERGPAYECGHCHFRWPARHAGLAVLLEMFEEICPRCGRGDHLIIRAADFDAARRQERRSVLQ
jgi:hypothetical protein